jgi:HEAT repeat protein
MLARMGKPALPPLNKKLSTREPIVRQAVLFGIGKIGDKTSTDTIKTLDAQILNDSTKPPMRALVQEMRAVRAMIGNH